MFFDVQLRNNLFYLTNKYEQTLFLQTYDGDNYVTFTL